MDTLGVDLTQVNAFSHIVILGALYVVFQQNRDLRKRLDENGIPKKRRR